MSGREREGKRRTETQQGSPEGAVEEWGLMAVVVGGKWAEEEVQSEPELVDRWMSVVVVVELKLMLWRSSAMSSAHGSMRCDWGCTVAEWRSDGGGI